MILFCVEINLILSRCKRKSVLSFFDYYVNTYDKLEDPM